MNKYLVRCPYLGITVNGGKVIEAPNAKEAAKTWAEWNDFSSCEYWIAKGNTVTVIVFNIAIGVETKFTVTGETVPRYSAEELDE